MIDIHTHIIPGVDDGSRTFAESIEMVQKEIDQGVTHIIATPHSDAFNWYANNDMLARFLHLLVLIEEKGLPVVLLRGTEIASNYEDVNAVIKKLDLGIYLTLNGSRYVLLEFDPLGRTSDQYVKEYVAAIYKAGYYPVIAHAERYPLVSLNTLRYTINLNGIVQINAYSIVNETKKSIKERARLLLNQRIVGAIGSDAHRLDHRPPIIGDGVRYLNENYDAEYVNHILYNNVKERIIG